MKYMTGVSFKILWWEGYLITVEAVTIDEDSLYNFARFLPI